MQFQKGLDLVQGNQLKTKSYIINYPLDLANIVNLTHKKVCKKIIIVEEH